jgi:hypothetical protein
MKLKTCMAALALCSALPMAMAAAPDCSNGTTVWGSFGPPGLKAFGNSFSSARTYSDCFTFSLAKPADSFGGVFEWDLSRSLSIDVTSVALYSSLNGLVEQVGTTDTSPSKFSFGSLAGGAATYTLEVVSEVAGSAGGWVNVGYRGLITTVATPVPEPAAYALGIVGLMVVGAWARLRRAR